jgi:PKD repeat protein
MTNPVFDYGHVGGCGAVTGGAFVPNGSWPASFDNGYLFGDYDCGKIQLLRPDGTTSDFVTGLGASSATAMAFGGYQSGQALFYTAYTSNPNAGQLHRVSYHPTGANQAPTAAVTATPPAGSAPLAVSFDGAGSRDPDAGDAVASYTWEFGDGTPAQTTTGATVTHTYQSAGAFTASLTVTDTRGATSVPATVTVHSDGAAPTAVILSPGPDDRFVVGQGATLSGTGTDWQGNPLPDSALSWVVKLHHNDHTHPFMPPTTGNNLAMPPAPGPEGFGAALTSYLEVHLTVTDARGVSTEVARNYQPALTHLAFATDPPGLALTVEDGDAMLPAGTYPSWVGYPVTVTAADTTDQFGRPMRFTGWSDGGTARHTVVSPAADTTYTAAFAPAPDPLLSAGRPARASSSGSATLAPANAVDGNLATRWASAPGADPQWIQVDLGATAHVSRVTLTWDLSCARAYRVQTSTSGSSWHTIYSTTTGDGGVDDLTGLNGTGRYVRVYGTVRCRSDATHGYSLKEIAVYGTVAALRSTGRPVTASSSAGGFSPGNAVDGNLATRWASAPGADPQWIAVDLGTAYHITQVRLTWDAECGTAYDVQVSLDGVTWTRATGTTTGNGGVDNLTGLTRTGRYVRVFGTARCLPDAAHGYSLQEFAVYGAF